MPLQRKAIPTALLYSCSWLPLELLYLKYTVPWSKSTEMKVGLARGTGKSTYRLFKLVADTKGRSCESQGSPKRIACALTIYLNDVICTIAWPLRKKESKAKAMMRMPTWGQKLIRSQQSLNTMCRNETVSISSSSNVVHPVQTHAFQASNNLHNSNIVPSLLQMFKRACLSFY